MVRRGLLGLVLSLLAMSSLATHAQTWPSRPVRIVVPYAAGGNSDAMARIVGQRLSETLGQAFIVEYRVGGNGSLASETVARWPADGYTLRGGVTPPMTSGRAVGERREGAVSGFGAMSGVGM